jgi:hypothetical protein
MRIVFNIEVGIDVPSYVQAGEVLDKITRDLEGAIGPKGSYDVRNFQTDHTPIRRYSEPMQAMDTGSFKDA